MTVDSSRHSSSRSQSSHRSTQNRDRTRSRSRQRSGDYSGYDRSRSVTRSSHSLSRSRSSYSRSRSRSWTRSRSRSQLARRNYSSRSRSGSRSVSRGSDRGRRSRDRSHSSSRSGSWSRSGTPHSASPSSFHEIKVGEKDPRDRSRRIKWTNNIWLVGEKAKDTTFHFCDACDLPVVIYGRLLPCKHVLCYTCAVKLAQKCNRCQKSIQTVERCLVGGIFMCFANDGCRRTYLSQRDLQAHIDHRHRGVGGIVAPVHSINQPEVSLESKATCAASTMRDVSSGGSSTHITVTTATGGGAVSDNVALNLLTSLHRQQPTTFPLTVVSTVTSTPSIDIVSSTPVHSKFPQANTTNSLLPLPKQLPLRAHMIPPPSVNASVGINSPNLRGLPPPSTFAPLPTRFNTPPPSIVNPPIAHPPPLMSIAMPSIPPPTMPTHTRPLITGPAQNFDSTSAVAALAAALCGRSGPRTSLGTTPDLTGFGQRAPGIGGSQLQPPGGINLSLLSNALKVVNSNWTQCNTGTVAPIRLQQPQQQLGNHSPAPPATQSGNNPTGLMRFRF